MITLMSVIVAFLFAISLWYLSSNHKVTSVKLKATYLKLLPNRGWHGLIPAGGTFVSATGGTFQSDTPGTFVSAMGGTFDSDIPGTFESDTGGTFNPLLSLDKVSTEAKASPRLRMNYNFHQSLDDLCHRMLNAIEPGTDIPIHRHPTKDESFVVLRGKVRSTIYNDDGSVIESVVHCAEEGRYGVDIPKGVWHKLESLESGSCGI